MIYRAGIFGLALAALSLPALAVTVPSAPPSAAAPVTPGLSVPASTATAPGAAPLASSSTAPTPDPAIDGASDLQTLSQAQAKLHDTGPAPAADESLFFTPWQHALLQEAKRGFLTRPVGAASASAQAAKPSIREISLDGIVYHGPHDWTIYLNSQRVAPNALPEQVMDLKVYNDYVDLKWFDTPNNLIFPIRLRAHQRFNLDARMFLPGVGTETLSSAQ